MKTKAELMKSLRDRLKAAGLRKVEIWVPDNEKSIEQARKLCKRNTIKRLEKQPN